ncbi:unnamed protein product [Victoria cruziana]
MASLAASAQVSGALSSTHSIPKDHRGAGLMPKVCFPATSTHGWKDVGRLKGGFSVRTASPAVESPAVERKKKEEEFEEEGSAVVVEEDYDKLAAELQNASPLEIMDSALARFGNDIAIAFSGAEDVALIEYARLTGRPFRVFSLDTGRLNPETYQFFDAVEKHYGIHIEYMFPDAVEVQALVRTKGLFSFYEDGHQECCRVRKVRPLRRALKGLRAWITGQRKDQSPGTRAHIPVVQVDPSFEGMDGGAGSLIKWNPVANVNGLDIWNFLRAMNVPVNSLHSQGYVSIGCEPCTRPVLPGQHEREGRWWWEDAKAKECGLHKGNIGQQVNGNGSAATNGSAAPSDIFNSKSVVSLGRPGIENLTKVENRREPWLVVLYAPWCRFCQVSKIAILIVNQLNLQCLHFLLPKQFLFFLFRPWKVLSWSWQRNWKGCLLVSKWGNSEQMASRRISRRSSFN